MTPKSRQERFPGEWFYKCYQAVHRLGRDRTNMVKKIWKMLNIIPQFEARFETHMRWQGCRFGPESSRQTLVSPLFRSSLVPCVAACWGQICNLGVVIADSHISNNNCLLGTDHRGTTPPLVAHGDKGIEQIHILCIDMRKKIQSIIQFSTWNYIDHIIISLYSTIWSYHGIVKHRKSVGEFIPVFSFHKTVRWSRWVRR